MLKIVKIFSIFLAGSLLGVAVAVWAFNNPTQPPPDGSGLLIVDNGKIGIGATAPLSAQLQIVASSSVDSFLVQSPSGNPSLAVKNSGSVDINNPVTNSAYKLNVKGDTNVSGKLTVGQLCFGSNCSSSWSVVPGMIAMFDVPCSSIPGGGWTQVAALNGRFPLGGDVYGAAGGSLDTTPPNGGQGSVGTGGSLVINYAYSNHQHLFMPPYTTVVWCKKNP